MRAASFRYSDMTCCLATSSSSSIFLRSRWSESSTPSFSKSADFQEPGIEDVVRKVNADLEKEGVELSDHRLRKKMDELLEIAKQQVMAE